MSSGSDSSLSSLLMIPDQRVSAQDLVRGNYTLAGWLRKRGRLNVIPGARKVFPWLHQFVVLHEGCLYTFKNETAKKPLRAFSLYGYNTVYRAGEVLPAEAPWAFKICHTFPEYKTYYFSAMTEQHMKEWMKQVKHEMKRANNKLKQRTRADGQDEDEQSISYEDIEREIYSDPSQLVITDKTPLPPRQDDESDEEYVDAERPPDTPVLPRIISKPLPPPVKLKPKPKLGKQQVSPEKDLQQGITAEFKERLGVSPNPRKKPVELPVRKPPDGKNFTLTDRVERKPPNLPIRPGHGRTLCDDESPLKNCPRKKVTTYVVVSYFSVGVISM
ncbi:SH3 domain-binding protein 2-like [Liolophura sinensis]|uniref:SH3 domain-binding protein 2-like n=1 Tax=Liolophura sinensis TaxID=3198878 RepID=UPI0031594C09